MISRAALDSCLGGAVRSPRVCSGFAARVLHRAFPATTVCVAALLPFAGASQEVAGTEPNRGGTINLDTQDPQIARERLHVADGYEISLFASEQDFPLANPVSLTFDGKGRLWVATMPTYPQRLPEALPDDKILILEDVDGDGRADTHTVFLDGLHLPTGFELGDGGAYIAQQPNLIFARDTDGDDVADETEVILHGFGTEDSHHSISVFQWGPGGGLYFQEGTFHHSQIETPYGPVRLVNAGVFRYEPTRFRLEVFVSYPFANPWGHVFDRWGQNFIADASGGANYFGSALTGHIDYPAKHDPMKVFTTIVRPTAGAEIVRSRHFPEAAQGNFLINNTIGFQGIKQHRMIEEGSGFTSEEVEPLLYSEDINFRPVDLQFGPDGALYIVDWFNPLIGHMQYSLRDPGRDTSHGRIWRITAKNRPLLDPPDIAGASVPALLDLLKAYEDRTRYRVRIELRNRDRDAALTALDTWIASLDPADPDHERYLLEALWVRQTLHAIDANLLERVLRSREPRARAAATRVLRFWRTALDNPLAQLEGLVHDPHPRVRLEAVLALSFFPEQRAAETALQVLDHPMDYYLDYVLNETIKTLRPYWRPAIEEGAFRTTAAGAAERYLLDRVAAEELQRFAGSEAVYAALLERTGVDSTIRREALDALAGMRGSSPVKQLIALIDRVQAEENASTKELVEDLTGLLLDHDARRLQRERADLVRLATTSPVAGVRSGAFAALMRADASGDDAWEIAKRSPETFDAFLAAVPRVPEPRVRDSLLRRLSEVVSARPPGTEHAERDAEAEGRRALIRALGSMTASPTERFSLLTSIAYEAPDMIESVVEALARVPEVAWPREALGEVAASLRDYVQTLPVDRLSHTSVQGVFKLGRRLIDRMPATAAASLSEEFAAANITVLALRPVPHKMLFDRTEFTVAAGRPVEIFFENSDIMPHNVVLTAPGRMEAVGRAADAMQTDPDAQARGYVPLRDDVLFATDLLNPGDSARLAFIAPSTPGDYPFVCTYPGHWITMNGVLRVVEPDDRALLASKPDAPSSASIERPQRSFVRFWEIDDLRPHLPDTNHGRSFVRGQAMFTAAGCIECHRIRGAGTAIGPDLDGIGEKYSALGLLEHILEPSNAIAEEYRAYMVDTASGWYSGIIVDQTPERVRMRANPRDPDDVLDLPRRDIRAIDESPISTMPQDLLITLDREEILDLIAYLRAGGNPDDPAFAR